MYRYKQWVKGQYEKLEEDRKRTEFPREKLEKLKRLPQDGRRFEPGDEVVLTYHGEKYPETFHAVVRESVHNSVKIEYVGNSLTVASNRGWSSVNWVAPNLLQYKRVVDNKNAKLLSCFALVGVVVVGFIVLVLVSASIENFFENDTWTLSEEQKAEEKQFLEHIDPDKDKVFTYEFEDGENYRDEEVVAKKYGYECSLIGSSLTKTGKAGESPYATYECRKQ